MPGTRTRYMPGATFSNGGACGRSKRTGGLETVGGQTPDADAQAFRYPGYAHDPAKPAAFRAEFPLFGKQRRKGTGRVHAELPAHHVQPRDGSGGVHIPGLLRFQMPRSNDFGGDAALSAGDKEDSRTRMVVFPQGEYFVKGKTRMTDLAEAQASV